MSLEEKVMAEIKTAMKAKDKAKLRGLRAIKSAIQLENTSGQDRSFDEAGEIKLLQKLVKQRQDSLEIYETQGREDLAETEREEIAVIQQFLPKPLDEAELTDIIKTIVTESGATGMKDIGKVMGIASQKVAGRADGKTISAVVKNILMGG